MLEAAGEARRLGDRQALCRPGSRHIGNPGLLPPAQRPPPPRLLLSPPPLRPGNLRNRDKARLPVPPPPGPCGTSWFPGFTRPLSPPAKRKVCHRRFHRLHHTHFKYNHPRNAYYWRESRRRRARGGALWKDPPAASRVALHPPGRVLLRPGARPVHRSRPGRHIWRPRKAGGRRHPPARHTGEPGLLSGRREVSDLRRAQEHLRQDSGTGRRASTSAQTPRIARSPWKSKACSPSSTATSPRSERSSQTGDGTNTCSRWSIRLGAQKLVPSSPSASSKRNPPC